MEQRPFTIRAFPTGSHDSEVVLSGVFFWEFDAAKEHLVSVAVRDLQLSRDQFLASTGTLYKFSHKVVDLSEKRSLETVVSGSKGLRDTAKMVVRLMAKHNDGAGMVNTILAHQELRDAGDRYFEPPLAQ